MHKKILVLGPGRNTRGGITSVIRAHEETKTWQLWNCLWVQTYVDKNTAQKLFYFIRSLILYAFSVPISSVVHIHLSEHVSAFRKNFFFRLAKLFNIPTILHFHAFSSESTLFGPQKKRYEKMFNSADYIIVLSETWRSQVETLVNSPAKIKVIHNPCPTVSRTHDCKKDKTILFAGTLIERKGYADLIKSFSQIAHCHSDWSIVFAGNGDIVNARSLAKEMGVEGQIFFKGWVSGDEKDNLFKSASIFCLPSYAEGFPMAVLDAWSYGLPVITTPVGGLPDILSHGENALVFEPGEISALASCLRLLIEDAGLRLKLSNASIKLSEGPFSLQTISQQLNDLYSQVTNK